ncbi:hypothetical protein BH10PSE14_BH10PSE14_07970 [soil metagenome]
MKKTMMLVAATLAVAAGGATAASHAMKGARYTGQAKVSLASARAAALKARPGKITDQELERERGGSGLRYSFDIKAGARTYEVGIDATSGAVLENGAEGAHPD